MKPERQHGEREREWAREWEKCKIYREHALIKESATSALLVVISFFKLDHITVNITAIAAALPLYSLAHSYLFTWKHQVESSNCPCNAQADTQLHTMCLVWEEICTRSVCVWMCSVFLHKPSVLRQCMYWRKLKRVVGRYDNSRTT